MVKTDFDTVARETGYTNPRSASNKLSAMKKNAAASATSSSNGKPTTTVSRDAKVTKQKPVPRKGKNKTSSKVAGEATESTNSKGGRGGQDEPRGAERSGRDEMDVV